MWIPKVQKQVSGVVEVERSRAGGCMLQLLLTVSTKYIDTSKHFAHPVTTATTNAFKAPLVDLLSLFTRQQIFRTECQTPQKNLLPIMGESEWLNQ